MSYSIIAAVGKNRELGKNNELIWHLPEDLKYFRKVTSGKTVIMGQNTFYSLPRMLPKRHHVVLSENNDFPNDVEVFNNLDSLLETYNNNEDELFIIGGAYVYSEFLNLCDKLYLTEIDAECKDASVYFPEFDKSLYEREVLCEHLENDPPYKHVLYKKIK